MPRHRCNARFKCFLLEDDSLECEGEEEATDCPTEDTGIFCSPDSPPVISLHALQGQAAPSMLRLPGQIKGKSLTVLVDSGSTHNFLQTRVAKHLGLQITPVAHLWRNATVRRSMPNNTIEISTLRFRCGLLPATYLWS